MVDKVNKMPKDLKDYYDRTCRCLLEDNKIEELIFFKMCVELAARQNELAAITFKQVDLDNLVVTDIESFKEGKIYPPKNISKELGGLIKNHLSGFNDEKLFKKSTDVYKRSIRESNGDEKFLLHIMRHIGKLGIK